MAKEKLGSKLILEPPGDVQVMFDVGLPSAIQFRGTVSVSFAVCSGETCVMVGGAAKRHLTGFYNDLKHLLFDAFAFFISNI